MSSWLREQFQQIIADLVRYPLQFRGEAYHLESSVDFGHTCDRSSRGRTRADSAHDTLLAQQMRLYCL